MSAWRPPSRALLLILALAVVETFLLPLLLHQQGAPILGGDGHVYDELANSLLDTGTFSDSAGPNIFRTIGYPGFIAVVYAASGRSYFALRAAQTLLLLFASWGLYRVALRFFDRRTAATAAVLCALYLPFVFAANYHLTEVPAVLLSVMMLLAFVNLIRAPHMTRRHALALGLTAGLMALVRPSFALMPAVLVLAVVSPWARGTWRERKRAVALIALGFCACVAPWTLRNAQVTHRFLPLATGSGPSLYVSALQYTGQISYAFTLPEWQTYIAGYNQRVSRAQRAVDEMGADPGINRQVARELRVDAGYRREAVEVASSIIPAQLPANLAKRFVYFWSTGDLSPWGSLLLHRVVQVQHAVLMLLSGAGVWLNRRKLVEQWPLWIVPIYLLGIHTIFHMEPRYSFPARPFLLIYAANTLTELAGRFGLAAWPRPFSGAAAVG